MSDVCAWFVGAHEVHFHVFALWVFSRWFVVEEVVTGLLFVRRVAAWWFVASFFAAAAGGQA